jgi:2-methylisocitrate lyase-like PEP mutase family enzyme
MASKPTSNSIAQSFKALHKPGNPLVLTNVWSIGSANLVASLPQTKALATASFAVAREQGLDDDDLTYEQNLAAIRGIATVASKHKLPLTADFQDGYGDKLAEGIVKLVEAGVVGINLEDYVADGKDFYDIDQAVERIKVVLERAKSCGVPDFVVNARTDVLVHGGSIDDAIERGKAYLAAGATTVFVWGRQRGLHDDEIVRLVEAFGGRLSVIWKPDGLTVKQIAELGVARISLGPKLQLFGEQAMKKEVERLLEA